MEATLAVMSPSMNIQASQSTTAGSLFSAQFDVEILGDLMSLQRLDSPHQTSPLSPSQAHFTSANYLNQHSLMDWQLKRAHIQQLQDLQTKYSSSRWDGHTHPTGTYVQEQHSYDLPTPISPTELHAQQQPLEFVSPTALNHSQIPHESHDDSMALPMPGHAQTHQTNAAPRGYSWAPRHIVFQNSPFRPYPGDLELDDDISLLISPWLGAKQNRGDNFLSQPSRKKKSSDIRLYNEGPSLLRRMPDYRGSHSTSSTPLLRSARLRSDDMTCRCAPAAPPSKVNLMENMPTANIPSTPFAPVTPASIMNLGRFQLDMVVTWDDATASRPASLTPPAPLKPISPDSGQTLSVEGATPIFQVVRKKTHKFAEQKRRDSLKTTFDDLRGLLPPIPLPSDNKYPLDEPVLPGALPPRGPPKAGSEGPNKGVSKLQLLMCGIDFIRQLRARVERRNEEITRLRQEVGRLRNVVVDTNGGHGYFEENVDPVDLELDLDETEVMSSHFASIASIGTDNEADEKGEHIVLVYRHRHSSYVQ
ncbi:hypothetical protein DFS33DRAFT_1488079 [Desarmillaria ectypa]|nr:hypothetical protein DFS33DRAFT_1488079 [Desarmillaria ectypa]